jgi:hypothetical protein
LIYIQYRIKIKAAESSLYLGVYLLVQLHCEIPFKLLKLVSLILLNSLNISAEVCPSFWAILIDLSTSFASLSLNPAYIPQKEDSAWRLCIFLVQELTSYLPFFAHRVC